MLRALLILTTLVGLGAADKTLSLGDLQKHGVWSGDGRLVIKDAASLFGGRDTIAGLARARALSIDCRQADISATDLAVLVGLPVREFSADGNTRFTDEHLAVVGRMASLESLSVARSSCTSGGLAALRLPSLRQLGVSGMVLDKPILFGLPSVTHLLASECNISSGSLAAPVNAKLSFLNLSRAKVAPGGLGRLAGYPALAEVVAIGCTLAAVDVAAIADCAALKHLDCDSASVEGGFDAFLRLKNLETLNLSGTGVDDAFVARAVATLPISYLLLADTKQVTDESMRAIAMAANVRQLVVNGTAVTSAGLGQLRQAGRLTGLGAANLGLGDDGVRVLFAKGWEGLGEIDLSGNDLTDVCIPFLAQAKTLKILNLAGNRFSPTGAAELRRLLPAVNLYFE